MSEEVLQALLQLFAIIANQDDGSRDVHLSYVNFFLRSQISEDRIEEFVSYYNNFIKVKEGDDQGQRRTAMKDSVRTLAICKKINKTLNQKQKYIVFTRLLEFIRQDGKESFSRAELIATVSDVFNVAKEDFQRINRLLSFDLNNLDREFLLVRNGEDAELSCRQFAVPGFHGECLFLLVRDINIILFIYNGDAELSLNGLPVKAKQVNIIPPGSSLRHPRGTVFYSDIINLFLGETFANAVEFIAYIGEHCHPNGKLALHELTIREKSGTLVGIMGASGSGKTTLLNVMSGNDRLYEGHITINGLDLWNDNKITQGYVGFIPQDDLLIEELTVYQNLFLNARLCFRSVTEQELNFKVIKLLNALGLIDVKDIRVGNPLNKKISGGQRKRLNIALELIREPQILFVDEPTSGLSSRDSENVMDLLKELSHKGKLIFVVIHQPSSDIYKLFDRIFMLDTGGYPVYYGNPIEALVYIKQQTNQVNSHLAECHSCGSVNPEVLFNLLEAREIDEYGNYTAKRKISAESWFTLFRRNFSVSNEPGEALPTTNRLSEVPGKLRQWMIFVQRDVLAKLANTQYLLINLLEVPVLAFFLAIAIRYINRSSAQSQYSFHHNENIPAFFFMSIIVGLLVGLTISAEEIYKDQKILKREKFLRLSRASYLLSKVFILFSISALQSLVLVMIGFMVLEIPNGFLPFWGVTFSVFCSANLVGLILSSSFNSPVTIYIIIPLVIIPQMLLGGAMFKYSRLNEAIGGDIQRVPLVSQFMVSRWAYEGIIVDQFRENTYERQMFPFDKLESELNYHIAYAIPKIEELKIKVRKDTSLNAAQKESLSRLVNQLTIDETENVKPMVGSLSPEDDTLEELRERLNVKYAEVDGQKAQMKEGLAKLQITSEFYTNKSTDENLTNALEKNKILLDSSEGKLIQVIDPVFRSPDADDVLGLQAHFYSPYKVFFGKKMPTVMYNLLIIWILNICAFIALQTDALKKIIGLTNYIRRI